MELQYSMEMEPPLADRLRDQGKGNGINSQNKFRNKVATFIGPWKFQGGVNKISSEPRP